MHQTDLVSMSQSTQHPSRNQRLLPFVMYLARAVIGFGLLILLAEWMITGSLLLTLTAMLGLGAAMLLPALYRSTVKQIQRLHAFQEKGRLYRVFSNRAGRVALWCLYCFVLSLFTLVELHTYNFLELLLFLTTIPIFYAVYQVIYFVVRREMRPYLVTAIALNWACFLCPVLLVVLYAAVFLLFGDLPAYDSLQAAVADQKQYLLHSLRVAHSQTEVHSHFCSPG